ncbi:MAG: hypothetical protein QXU32_07010 [Nitrososphaerales archaeon]
MRGEIIVEPEPREKKEPVPQSNTVQVDFNDPASGVKRVSFPNGTIKSMQIDLDFHSLVINVENVQSPGKLTITLDRNLIDSKENENDDSFLVLIDGEEGFYDETASTPNERTLEIVVPSRAKVVEIFGTQVIPEFPVTMFIIVIMFTAMLAAFRLRFK